MRVRRSDVKERRGCAVPGSDVSPILRFTSDEKERKCDSSANIRSVELQHALAIVMTLFNEPEVNNLLGPVELHLESIEEASLAKDRYDARRVAEAGVE